MQLSYKDDVKSKADLISQIELKNKIKAAEQEAV